MVETYYENSFCVEEYIKLCREQGVELIPRDSEYKEQQEEV